MPLNHDWLYMPTEADANAPDYAFIRVTLPHTNVLLPHKNFDDAEYQFISTYRRRFTLPEPLGGRRVYLDFEGVLSAAEVSVNGHSFGEHRGGFVPFSHDITDALDPEGENLITVRVDSRERADIPPHGHTVDYMVFGGIYREVSLRYVSPVHIVDVFARPVNVMSDSPRVEVDITVRNQGTTAYSGELGYSVLDADGNTVSLSASDLHINALQPGAIETFTIVSAALKPITRWSLDTPALYRLSVWLDNADARDDIRFGFREAQFRDDGFYLNGERIQLMGLNRHQNYPYIGAAAPARLQRRDADILRYELACNIVRTSHYPQSRHFIDRCDEIGLLVFEEIPGWQHIGDEAWKALALRDVRVMIERDRNHPSIIIWGVRINESWDDHEFYSATNQLARQLDPTRPTGGVRFFMGSEFLEDVYTLNDFSNDILEPEHTPHLVTEFNGHMFPTKTWDHDARRVEHALRHVRIHSRQMSTGGVSGAIGWCAFDYNTHREFGAGDRICHHGVMDIFRLPKYAARWYESQQSPRIRPVVFAATNWRLGDYDEGLGDSVVIFSNCDEVEVYVGDARQGRYLPARDRFPALRHPPFFAEKLDVRLAQPYGDLRVVGYLDGEPVAEHRIDMDNRPHTLALRADDEALTADGIDMTRVVFQITDKYGNPLPYATSVVSFTLSGDTDAQLIGENPFALVGGGAAVYIKAGLKPGTVMLSASTPRLPPAQISIRLEAERPS